MRGTHSQSPSRRLAAFLLVFILTLAASSPALATSPADKIRAAREQARDAQKALDNLSANLEERSEEYFAAREQLEKTRQRVRIVTAELAEAEQEVTRAQAQLNRRATSIYRGGEVGAISVFVGVSDFQEMVTRLELMSRVGRSDAALVARVEGARERVARAKRALEARRAEQVALVRRTRTERAKVEEALSAQKHYLGRIDRNLEKLIARERERQERIARERAEAKARSLAAARKAAASSGSKTSVENRGGGGGSVDPANLPEAHGSVVSVARSFVGKVPYVWGGTTPEGFDCSGLTMYCYRQVGVSLPRTSRQQYNAGARIPADRLDLLRAGDLVFFGYEGSSARIHHVGIYSGSGRYIHAPQAGMDVSESSLLARIETRGDYVGAVRP